MNGLLGTCDFFDVEEFCEEHGFGEDEVTGILDQHIFQCSACGWWCGIEEESSEGTDSQDWICEECARI